MSSDFRTREQYEWWHVRDCARCGREVLLLGGRLCERCTTGPVRPPMRALAGTVLSTVRHKSALQWLRDPRVPELLSGLATGTIPLTREALFVSSAAVVREF